ncbi:MAG: hypothetical protein KC964_06750, partial [Candidatus Omnitrophica bacterium]|nr:hypothetical protein [Candidatus Omnitrophota bacterium]
MKDDSRPACWGFRPPGPYEYVIAGNGDASAETFAAKLDGGLKRVDEMGGWLLRILANCGNGNQTGKEKARDCERRGDESGIHVSLQRFFCG